MTFDLPYIFLLCYTLMIVDTDTVRHKRADQNEKLLHISTFEANEISKDWGKEVCRPGAIIASDSIARKGKYSARFELSKTDALHYNGYVRAELKQGFKSDTTGEGWYGFSNYLSDNYVSDPVPEVVAQWHEIPDWNLGENWRSPPIALEIKNDKYAVKVLWSAAAVNTNKTKDGEIAYDLGAVDKNKWNDWVFHIKFRFDSTGIIEVWKNKTKVLSRKGPNSYNDKRFPYFKVGIYKWGWASSASRSPEDKRVLYIDEIRVGNRNANLKAVSPK